MGELFLPPGREGARQQIHLLIQGGQAPARTADRRQTPAGGALPARPLSAAGAAAVRVAPASRLPPAGPVGAAAGARVQVAAALGCARRSSSRARSRASRPSNSTSISLSGARGCCVRQSDIPLSTSSLSTAQARSNGSSSLSTGPSRLMSTVLRGLSYRASRSSTTRQNSDVHP